MKQDGCANKNKIAGYFYNDLSQEVYLLYNVRQTVERNASMMKKHILIGGIVLCIHLLYMPCAHGETPQYIVEEIQPDQSVSKIVETSNLAEASTAYEAHLSTSHNLVLRNAKRVLDMKYGVVLFKKSETCDYNVTYQTAQGDGYVNGCYGIDGAYLSTQNNHMVNFLISGAFGSTSEDDVTLLPIENAETVSIYQVKDQRLYHHIKTDMDDERYSNSILLGDAPDELTDGEYYSYDGHFFYAVRDDFSGFHDMIDDVRKQTNAHAINRTPYYNYYQYLTHRSTSDYRETDLNRYVQDELHIRRSLTTYRSIHTSSHGILTQSLFKDNMAAFLQYQDQLGVNAMMMLALSMNESAVGRSYLAFTRNNLFGHAAFDSAVEENASRYQSVSASVYSHALHYLQESYLNPDSFTWHGGYFGNKASGMNVSYASDPYWGEKAAQYFCRLDEALGKHAFQQETLGFVQGTKNVSVYASPNEDAKVLYETHGNKDFAFLILRQQGAWYQIQCDPSTDAYSYDFQKNVGYVKQSDIDYLNQEPKEKSIIRYPITFDAQDGKFENKASKVTLFIPAGQMPSILPPIKEGSLFMEWNQELSAAEKEITYTAQYASVKEAKLSKMPKQAYEVDEPLDVQDGVLSITLAQGAKKDIPLNSSMVSGFDFSKAGKQTLYVTYQGIQTSYDVEVSDVQKNKHEQLFETIQSLLHSYSIDDSMDADTKEQFLSVKEEIMKNKTPDLSLEAYRILDACIQKAYGFSLQVMISDDDSDMSVSGLGIATQLDPPSLFPQVLNFTFSKGIDKDHETLLKQVGEGNGYTLEYCFSLSANVNFHKAEIQDDLIISIKKPEETKLNNHYVVLRYQDGEVVQMITSQSNSYITFTTDKLGDYALISTPAASSSQGNDIIENNSVHTNGLNIFSLLIYIGCVLLFIILVIMTIIIRKKRKKASLKNSQKNNNEIQPHNTNTEHEHGSQ